ncbi:MAG: hypothetical protein AAF578_02840 [Pseudomonadota bacterium]
MTEVIRVVEKPLRKLIALMVLALSVDPQLLDAAEERHQLRISSTNTSESDFGNGQKLSERQQSLRWLLPEMEIAAMRVSTGMHYAYTRYEYQTTPSRDRDLHMLQIPVSLAFGSDQRQWQVQAAPGIATSSNVSRDLFNRATSDDAFLTGEATFSNRGPSSLVVLGLAHDRRFGRPLTYPKLAWRGGSERLTWQLGLPDAWVDFRPWQNTLLSLGAGPVGMQWHTVRDDFQSDFEYRTRRWDMRLEVHQNITHSIALSLHAGRAFDRRHRFEADTSVILDLSANNAWFAGVSLSVGKPNRPPGYANAFWMRN